MAKLDDILEIKRLSNEAMHLDTAISKLDEVSVYINGTDVLDGSLKVNVSYFDTYAGTSLFDKLNSSLEILKPSNWSKLFKKKEKDFSDSFYDSLFFPSFNTQTYSIEEQIDRLLDEYSKTGDYRILDKIRNLRDFDKQQFQDFLLRKKVKLQKRLSFVKRVLTLVNYIINLRTAFLKKIKHVIKRLDDEHELIFN